MLVDALMEVRKFQGLNWMDEPCMGASVVDDIVKTFETEVDSELKLPLESCLSENVRKCKLLRNPSILSISLTYELLLTLNQQSCIEDTKIYNFCEETIAKL